ncbi:MAG: vitamin B12-dependent ribonucleotide reductase [Gemmatimonadetes bacterium]|nr:vitamin B12-dependent ribonucleotide reductase [Gemmatimonadota bacterium]NIO32058.1 vitamin B12-dependent ribonucleotide reductase [Gemmatimonadota bacterium]
MTATVAAKGREIELPVAPPAGLPDPDLSENAITVLERRYLVKDDELRPIETPRELFWRVARAVAAVDLQYGTSGAEAQQSAERFYHIMADGQFEPNSPTLMNAGRPLGQLSACFVLPVEDSLEGIYTTLRNMALIHQSGGGTGFGFSRLRPSGDVVRSTMGVASGPVSFMEVYDASTEAVKQGGTRRGANMGILRVDHPDILKFIACKSDNSRVTNFNISVAVTDEFMRAVQADDEYDLVSPRNGEVVARQRARDVFDKIVEGAWANGEPGVFFVDQANYYNPVPHLGSYEATNPCGEQPLLPFDVCNLGSINLGAFVKEGIVDWDGLRQAVHTSTHFLDNVIDANRYPLPEITDLAQRIRRIGLGVMGWADMLVRLEIAYGSDESLELAGRVMQFVDEEAKVESERLAALRGVFPEWDRSIWGPDATCARAASGNRVRAERRLRNCNLTTVAPTGTISIIAGCSGGIEPLFAVAFMRNQAGTLMPDVNDDFVALARRQGWYSDQLMERIACEGHIHFDGVPEQVRQVFVTAHDVSPEQHVRMQAAFQRYVDSAISKTCNFPAAASPGYVRAIYELAYELGCKGVTVYRDGSREGQVLSTGKTAEAVVKSFDSVKNMSSVSEVGRKGEDVAGDAGVASEAELASLERAAENQQLRAELELLAKDNERLKRELSAKQGELMGKPFVRERPDKLRGVTRKMLSPLGTLYVTINEDEKGRPFEVFTTLGKAGGAAMADAEAISRLISLALRSGVPLSTISKQLRGISCDRAVGFGAKKILSVPDAVALAIEEYLVEKEGEQQVLPLTDPQTGSKGNGGTQSAEPPNIGRGLFDDPTKHFGRDIKAFIETCPDCGFSLQFAEGCMKCTACGYSECG